MAELSDEQVLELVEGVVADDFCEDLDCVAAFHPEELSRREKECHEKLSFLYRVVHSHRQAHSCFHVHESWREEAEAARLEAAKR